jgi:hypothetical protein
VDDAVVQAVQGQRGTASVVRPSLQSGQFLAACGTPEVDPGLDAHDPAGKRIKIGAKVVRRSNYNLFQLVEVGVPNLLFARFLQRIGQLRLACALG